MNKQRLKKFLGLILVMATLLLPRQAYAQESSLTVSDLQNLVHSLQVVKYNESSSPSNTMQCMVAGLLVQRVIRRLVNDGVTVDPAIQQLAQDEWPSVEVKTGMTWMALCQGGDLNVSNSLTLGDMQNLIHALKVVEYSNASNPTNSTACALTGLLAQNVIRRIVEVGVTTDPAIQQLAQDEWPDVEVKTGMTWMALCQGGQIQ